MRAQIVLFEGFAPSTSSPPTRCCCGQVASPRSGPQAGYYWAKRKKGSKVHAAVEP
jgi:hypothetical protein